mmetsp:Transcript_41170/g.129050  ORF Transcript_41170/g.129050 Transcript_41170/m.129050 type:complete len:222 (+) Transcript_41170:1231-1896(+)
MAGALRHHGQRLHVGLREDLEHHVVVGAQRLAGAAERVHEDEVPPRRGGCGDLKIGRRPNVHERLAASDGVHRVAPEFRKGPCVEERAADVFASVNVDAEVRRAAPLLATAAADPRVGVDHKAHARASALAPRLRLHHLRPDNVIEDQHRVHVGVTQRREVQALPREKGFLGAAAEGEAAGGVLEENLVIIEARGPHRPRGAGHLLCHEKHAKPQPQQPEQ